MGILSNIGNAFKKVGSAVKGVVTKVVDTVKPAIPIIGNVVGSVVSAIPVVGPLVGTAVNVVSNLVGGSGGSSGQTPPASVQIAGAATPSPVSAASVVESVVPQGILNSSTVAAAGLAGSWRSVYNGLTDQIK